MATHKTLKLSFFFCAFVCAQFAAAQDSAPTPEHAFEGEWISSPEFAFMPKQNVFHRQLDNAAAARVKDAAAKITNRHILFRKTFMLEDAPAKAALFFTADDYAKIYVNGKFAAQGPASGYNFHYPYHAVDIAKYLVKGANTIAVHTYYQGLINRVWVSGDFRHGFLCDLAIGGKIFLKTDSTWKCAYHDAYTACGKAGYDTQFLESYDASGKQVGFEKPDFDDSAWQPARPVANPDYALAPSPLPLLVFEQIKPAIIKDAAPNKIFVDFGAMYVGYFNMSARGKAGDAIELRFAQELNPDGSARHKLRANCDYVEHFRLSGCKDVVRQFDFKSFRYAESIFPDGVEIDRSSISLTARHMPFNLKARSRYAGDKRLDPVWNLCVRSMQYGAQEQIQDCMEREKGYYLGDGCYTVLAYCLLTKNYAPMRKLIDDFFRTSFIDAGLVTCANCAFMQEIAEYPLMMYLLAPVLAERPQDAEFIRSRMPKFRTLLDHYKKAYARPDGLLANLDKWCVVEWPANWRDGYDVDIAQGKVCRATHNVINAWYIAAIRAYNKAAKILGEPIYEGEPQLAEAFYAAFYDPQKKLFKDGDQTSHISFAGNIYAYFAGLYPEEQCRKNIVGMIDKYRLTRGMLFASFPAMAGLRRDGEEALLRSLLADPRTWSKMIEEGATATFEGWSKDAKWNTSLFHLTLAYALVFMVDDFDVGKTLDLRPSAK